MTENLHQGWYNACLPDRPTLLLGLRLQEYCLGHEILLRRLCNPLVADPGADESEARLPGPNDVIVAALVCATSFERGRALLHHPLLGLLLTVWRWRLRGFGFRRRPVNWLGAMRNFLEYRNAAYWRPEEAEPLTGRRLESPWPFRLGAFLMSAFHMSESEALSFPLGRASLWYAAHAEMEGKIDLVGEQFQAMLAKVAEMDASDNGEAASRAGFDATNGFPGREHVE